MNRSRVNLKDRYEIIGRPLILDGATGSLIQQRKIPVHKTLWASIANITHPEAVIQIHKEYLLAGAEIITTNTFRTNPIAMLHSNLNITNEEFIRCGVLLASESVGDNDQIIIAGSNAPAEDCYQAERTLTASKLEYNHKLHIDQLLESGCDLVWNETQSHLDEIKIIASYCAENGYPFVINLYFDSELNILSGEPVSEAVDLISDYSPDAIGFNCISSDTIKNFFEKHTPPSNWGFYLNCGTGNVWNENIDGCLDPRAYLVEIEPLLKLNPIFVGSCCGSKPAHTMAIRKLFNELY